MINNKNWVLGLVVLILIIGGLTLWGFSKKNTPAQIQGDATTLESYYSQDATVMEFYQDSCSWCVKQKTVMESLGKQGYRFKPMNIGPNHPENKELWKKYNIQGTPTFIAQNGERLEGYQTEEDLKAWMDKNK